MAEGIANEVAKETDSLRPYLAFGILRVVSRVSRNNISVVARELIMKHDAQIAMVQIWKIANSLASDIPDLKDNIFRHPGELMTSVML